MTLIRHFEQVQERRDERLAQVRYLRVISVGRAPSHHGAMDDPVSQFINFFGVDQPGPDEFHRLTEVGDRPGLVPRPSERRGGSGELARRLPDFTAKMVADFGPLQPEIDPPLPVREHVMLIAVRTEVGAKAGGVPLEDFGRLAARFQKIHGKLPIELLDGTTRYSIQIHRGNPSPV